MEPLSIVAWRKRHGINQNQLADMLNVARQTVIRWERGRTNVPDDLELQLMKLEGNDVTSHIERVTSHITPAAFPAVFTFNRQIGRFMPNIYHPNSLARDGLFGWLGCTWIDANFARCSKAHPDMMQMPQYEAALKSRVDGVQHPGVQAVRQWFNTGIASEGVEIIQEKTGPWPWLTLTQALEPLAGFNALPDAFPYRLGLKIEVSNRIVNGYYYHENKLVMLEDPE